MRSRLLALQALGVAYVGALSSTPTVTLHAPEEMAIIEDSKFDVDTDVALDAADTAEFQRRFRRQFICLSLDSAPYICYPIFGLSTKPRFVGLEDGVHTLEARITDPATGLLLPSSSSGTRVFSTMSPKPLQKFKPESPARGDEADPATGEPRVNIDMPRLAIKSPAEGASVAHVFNTVVTVQTATPETFNRHFRREYACMGLDAVAHLACFPVFGLRVMPRYVGVPPGEHRLVAKLTHPDSGDAIDGSSSTVRAFTSTAPPAPTPSAGAGAARRAQASASVDANGDADDVIDLDEPDPDADVAEGVGGLGAVLGAMATIPQAAMTPAGLREEFQELGIPTSRTLSQSGVEIKLDFSKARFFSEVTEASADAAEGEEAIQDDASLGLGVEGMSKVTEQPAEK